MAVFVRVASTEDVALGRGKMVEVSGKKIAIFNVDGNYYAIDNTCTHKGGPLSEGGLEGKEVTCPWQRRSLRRDNWRGAGASGTQTGF